MGKKVLLVEDNEKSMILETDLLEFAGFEVLQATTAKVGIELAQKEKPDVIVMDIRLPDMPGTEAIKILRQNKELANVPVIFVTASVITEGLAEVKSTPNSSYISKPINTHTFVQEVSKHIIK